MKNFTYVFTFFTLRFCYDPKKSTGNYSKLMQLVHTNTPLNRNILSIVIRRTKYNTELAIKKELICYANLMEGFIKCAVYDICS